MRVTPAERFLRELLADGAEHLSEAVQAEAEKRELSWRSVERARAKIPELTTYQKGFRGPWVMRLPLPKPEDNGTTAWPEYTAVTCNNCGRTGMYYEPELITCNQCALCTPTPTPTATDRRHSHRVTST